MANRYWVGGTATWTSVALDPAAASRWSATSGGAGGAGVPTNADDVFFDANSGAVTVTTGAFNTSTGKTLNFTGFTGTFAGSSAYAIKGNVTLSSGMSYTHTGVLSITDTGTLTSAGKTIGGFTINGSGITVQLADALTCLVLNLTLGTFTTNDYAVTCSSFSSSNSNIRTLNMGASAWTLTGTGTVWTTSTSTNLTFNKGTANILLSSNSTTQRIITGGTLTYNKITIGGTGTSVTLFANNSTYDELASTKTVAHTVRFATATSRTINKWSIAGSSSNVVTVDSATAGTQSSFTLTNQTTSSIDYLAVKDINVLTTDKFYVGANSTDNGNNTNVYFTAAPVVASNSNFFLMFG